MRFLLPLLFLLAPLPSPRESLHEPFGRLLKAHVKDGVVDYTAFKKEEKALDRYLAALAKTDVTKLSRKGRLAFWINAYNAFTVKLVLSHWPGLKSIRDLERPWTTRRWKAGGKLHSLNGIEHEILRKDFSEPRIHFALVCAARSCPDLRSEAYTEAKLEAQLADATRRFLADPKRGFSRSKKGDVVRLSRLFDWYGKDFASKDKSKIDFLLAYLPGKDRRWVEARRKVLTVTYLPYDWSLNGK